MLKLLITAASSAWFRLDMQHVEHTASAGCIHRTTRILCFIQKLLMSLLNLKNDQNKNSRFLRLVKLSCWTTLFYLKSDNLIKIKHDFNF
jgi:hypothetical protein